jgi:hypothetical protein
MGSIQTFRGYVLVQCMAVFADLKSRERKKLEIDVSDVD